MNPPIKPDESDCCNSGCSPCILDVYDEQLAKYKKEINLQTQQQTIQFNNCFSQTSYSIFKLVSKLQHTPDTYFLSFEFVKPHKWPSDRLVTNDFCIKYKPGQHVLLKGFSRYDKNTQFTRAYTPIPFDSDSFQSFTVLVKFYEVGEMTYYLKRLAVGAETLWRGPYCDYVINYNYKYMLMIAQGVGIAPLYSILSNMLMNDECETRIELFFCCRSVKDILLRNDLFNYKSYWNFDCNIYLTCKDNNDVPKYKENLIYKRLDEEHILQYFSKKSLDSIMVLICGTENFGIHFKDVVLKLGIKIDNVYDFGSIHSIYL